MAVFLTIEIVKRSFFLFINAVKSILSQSNGLFNDLLLKCINIFCLEFIMYNML